MAMDRLLALMAEKKASDLFVSAGAPVTIKINGTAVPVNQQRLDPAAVETLLREVLTDRQWSQFQDESELNFGYGLRNVGSFRFSLFRQRGTAAAVVRYIPGDVPQLENLNLPPVLSELIMEKRGLILVVGATGSGKTTTLAAMIDHRNGQRGGHILTLEDPIEYTFRNKRSIVNQRQIGTDAVSLQVALKNALRQAPDCLFIGEIRDTETMSAAIAYAQSGHLVLATLHANNSSHALNRIVVVLHAREPARAAVGPGLDAQVRDLAAADPRDGGRADPGRRDPAEHHVRVRADRAGPAVRDQGGHGEEHGARLADLRARAGRPGPQPPRHARGRARAVRLADQPAVAAREHRRGARRAAATCPARRAGPVGAGQARRRSVLLRVHAQHLMPQDVVVYGIDTCDQVRKARHWLRQHGVAFRFHDFRANGLDGALLARWMAHLPWDSLLNRRGLSWRQLDASRKAGVVDQGSATELMLEIPTLIKRPVLEAGDRIVVGFSEPIYQNLFP